MKIGGVASVAAAIVASTASRAADKPLIAPPAAWVKPIEIPKDDAASADAAVKFLLEDQQIDFEKDGTTTTYSEIVMRVQTPQGLAAGNISMPWNPETDTLTVHKLHIIRAGKVIDVLAKENFTILRRETNLENAMLDGVLTANIQPEGLQVGDVIDLATSLRHHDPAVGQHDEQLAPELGLVPINRVRIRARWPRTMPMHWRETDDLPAFARKQDGDYVSVELSADDLKPVVLPKGAPLRFAITRLAEFTDYASWSDLSAALEPLYAKAASVPPQGAIEKEIAQIAALSADSKVRAEAALALVQDRIRYVYLGLNDGGLMPAPAETTWARRFGDCKAKTVLLMALLRGLGIAADPVVVSTGAGDGIDGRLPMIGLFNHILVRAQIAGKTYWLDGTRLGDQTLDALQVPAFHWGLPLILKGAPLVAIMPPPLTRPNVTTEVRLDASAGIDKPAAAHVESLYRGDIATGFHLRLDNLTPDGRDRTLRDFWRGRYAFIEPKTVTATYDKATGEERLVLDGTADMDWTNGGYETDGTLIGYTANLTRDPGPHADAPFAVGYPTSAVDRETIRLPNGGNGFTLDDANLDRTVAGIEYHRRGSIANGIVSLERQVRSTEPEFPASDAPAVQEALRVLGRTAIYVRPPYAIAPVGKVSAAAPKAAPTTAGDWLVAGYARLHEGNNQEAATAFHKAAELDPKAIVALLGLGAAQELLGKPDLALASFEKAVALDPRSADALAARGQAGLGMNEMDAAMADFSKVLNIDPLEATALEGRGVVENKRGDHKAAMVDFTMALQINPNYAGAYAGRAEAFYRLGDMQRALADADKAVELRPTNPESYILRANIFKNQGKRDQSLAQAAALTAAAPNSDYAHISAGAIYAHFHHTDEAMREFSRALAIRPSEAAYINRANAWERDDIKHRQADIDAARKLAPGDMLVELAQAALAEQKKDYAAAIATRTAIMKRRPSSAESINMRGIDYARTGQTALAEQDFAAARAEATNAQMLNNLCFETAATGQSLKTALEECDAALAKMPGSVHILDSRAFVLLRMGRYADAITAYDKALASVPNLAASLYGRAIAEAHTGASAKAATDKAAALAVDPRIAEIFGSYGVSN